MLKVGVADRFVTELLTVIVEIVLDDEGKVAENPYYLSSKMIKACNESQSSLLSITSIDSMVTNRLANSEVNGYSGNTKPSDQVKEKAKKGCLLIEMDADQWKESIHQKDTVETTEALDRDRYFDSRVLLLTNNVWSGYNTFCSFTIHERDYCNYQRSRCGGAMLLRLPFLGLNNFNRNCGLGANHECQTSASRQGAPFSRDMTRLRGSIDRVRYSFGARSRHLRILRWFTYRVAVC